MHFMAMVLLNPAESLKAKDELSDLLLAKQESVVSAMSDQSRKQLLSVTTEAAQSNPLDAVHSVGVKSLHGEPTITVYVADSALRDKIEGLSPKAINGIPISVEVEEPAGIFPPKAGLAAGGNLEDSSDQDCSKKRQNAIRPIPGGVSVGNARQNMAGTLGAFCRIQGSEDVFALSNNHVLALTNIGKVGDDLYQPGRLDGGTEKELFANLRKFIAIQIGEDAENEVDAALGEVVHVSLPIFEICTIGPVLGMAEGFEDDVVCKHGRTTGYTEGAIREEALDVLIQMDHDDPHSLARFRNQIKIQTIAPYKAFGLSGDSGSLVVRESDRLAIGLYFAGPESGSYGLANPINKVAEKLQIVAFSA